MSSGTLPLHNDILAAHHLGGNDGREGGGWSYQERLGGRMSAPGAAEEGERERDRRKRQRQETEMWLSREMGLALA